LSGARKDIFPLSVFPPLCCVVPPLPPSFTPRYPLVVIVFSRDLIFPGDGSHFRWKRLSLNHLSPSSVFCGVFLDVWGCGGVFFFWGGVLCGGGRGSVGGAWPAAGLLPGVRPILDFWAGSLLFDASSWRR